MSNAEPSTTVGRVGVRVLIAEASTLNCQLVQSSLGRARQKLQVTCATVDTGIAISHIKDRRPDVAIVSERLVSGPTAGFAFVRTIRQLRVRTRSIMLLESRDRDAVIDAFGHGARGVVFRDEPLKVLTKCIQAVYAGQYWVNSINLGIIMDEFARLVPIAAHGTKGAKLLTKRQRDVVRLLNQGLSNRDIAAQSGLSEATVRNYLQGVFDRLGVSSRVELLTNYRSLAEDKGDGGDSDETGEQPPHESEPGN